MNRKSIALICLVAGVLLIPITTHGLIGWLSWPVSLALLSVGLMLFIQAKRARPSFPYQAESSYREEVTSDGQTCFHITPASLPKRLFTKVFCWLVIVAPVLYMDYLFDQVSTYDTRMYIFVASVIGLILVGSVTWKLGKELRTYVFPRRIYVTPTVINIPPSPTEKDGKSMMLMTSTIDRFCMEQSLANQQNVGMWYGNLYAPILNLTERAHGKHQNWLADHSYVVEAQAKGKRYVFAGGLDEVTAFGLMQAIERKAGF